MAKKKYRRQQNQKKKGKSQQRTDILNTDFLKIRKDISQNQIQTDSSEKRK